MRLIIIMFVVMSTSICNASVADSCFHRFDYQFYTNDSIYIDETCDTLELMRHCLELISSSKSTLALKHSLVKEKSRSVVSYAKGAEYRDLARGHERTIGFYMLYFIYNNLYRNDSNIYDYIYISKNTDNITGQYVYLDSEGKSNVKLKRLYKKWLKKVIKYGLEESRRRKITPFKGTKYKWVLIKE